MHAKPAHKHGQQPDGLHRERGNAAGELLGLGHLLHHFGHFRRHPQNRAHTARRVGLHRQFARTAVEHLEAFTGVGQADARAGSLSAAQAESVVGNQHLQRVRRAIDARQHARIDGDGATLFLGLQPVLDGVFHQGGDHRRRQRNGVQRQRHVDH